MVSTCVCLSIFLLSFLCCALPASISTDGAVGHPITPTSKTLDNFEDAKPPEKQERHHLRHRVAEKNTKLNLQNSIMEGDVVTAYQRHVDRDSTPPQTAFNLDVTSNKTNDSNQLEQSYSHRKGYRNHENVKLMRTSHSGTKKLPQAIIIGVKKGGTRALLTFLRIHPDVRAPGPEPHFFDRHYENGMEWYRKQMPSSLEGQLTMEKTPSYFVTKVVPQRIYNMSRSVKLIMVVRDPVTRAISDYTQAVTKRPDIKSFEQMAFLDNHTGLVDTSWGAIRIGVYAKHLERWLKFFPLKQIHFVNGEKLISNPAGELAKVQDFLGLKRVITDKHFYFNITKGFPCLKKPEGSAKPHCLGKSKGRPHPNIDPKVLHRLRTFFRPFNQKFYQMTGIDFGWP